MSAWTGGEVQIDGQNAVRLRDLQLGSSLVRLMGRRVRVARPSRATSSTLMWPRLAAVTRVEIVPIGSYIVKGDDAPQGERRHFFCRFM